jgi:cytochrome oxidase Cu insertion factor (SCO1/SenC/PrrC family)
MSGKASHMRGPRTRWVSPVAGLALAVGVFAVASSMGAAAPPESIEDLLFELQIVPLVGQAPAPFTLETLAGGRASLADFRGKVVLLYFWATW